MKGSDEQGPIRTLPPVLPDAPGTDGSRSPDPPDRRWVPIAMVGVVIAVLTAAGLFDSAAETDAEGDPAAATVPDLAGDTPPTTTASPSEVEAPPALAGVRSVVYRPDDGTTAWAAWFPSSGAPSPGVTGGADSAGAAVASMGRLVMTVTDETVPTLWIGRRGSVVPAFIDVHGAAWHSAGDGRIAFIGRVPGTDEYHLFTATVGSLGGLSDLVDRQRMSPRSELVAWGDWGFVLSHRVEPSLRAWEVTVPDTEGTSARELLHVTQLLHPSGRPRMSIPGIPLEVGPNGEMVIQSRVAAYRAARAAGHTDRQLGFLGDVLPVGEPDLHLTRIAVLGPDQEPTNARFLVDDADVDARRIAFLFTPDGTAVSMLSSNDGRLEATTTRLFSNALVRTRVDADRAIGFSRDGTYLAAQDDETGDLVLLDWSRGSVERIPFEQGRVLSLDF
jgi:hypothetical protein